MADADLRSATAPAVGTVSPAVESDESRTRGVALQRYLDSQSAGVRVERCARVSGGYETFIYEVRLAAAGEVAPALPVDRPLILRIYHGDGVKERSGWRTRLSVGFGGEGVPAPEVFLYESGSEALGGPFFLLEFVRGRRMDEAGLSAKPLTIIKMLRAFARAQTAIYSVDWPEGRLLSQQASSDLGPFAWAGDRLQAARDECIRRNLRPLLPVVLWLEEHRADLGDEPEVLIHGDFHPLNVFFEGAEVSAVIDWGSGGFANRHEDMGWSSMLLATVTAVDDAEDKKLAPFRQIARRVYLGFLWKSVGIGRAQLRYGEVYAALRWLLVFLPSYLPNAGEPILNPDAAGLTTPRYVRRVRRFIEQRTKLTLGIV